MSPPTPPETAPSPPPASAPPRSRPGLAFRTPYTRWQVTAAVAALALHGVMWFLQSQFLKQEAGETWASTQRQVVLACFWVIGTLSIWRISVPPSRLHAVILALLSVLFVAVVGSIVVLGAHALRGNALTSELLTAFSFYGGLLVLVQVVMALPAAVLLQAVALSRHET